MYLRRKVFSSFIDENGEEKYFSTTEFTDERLYADNLAEMEKQIALNNMFDETAHMTTDQSLENLSQYRNASNRVDEGIKIEQERAAREAAKEEAKKSGAVKRLVGKGKNWVKKTYGKGAKNRGWKIAGTAAIPVAATSAVVAGKAIKAKKARKQETNE